MEVLVWSDSHGHKDYVMRMLDKEPDCKSVFFLGDGLDEALSVQKLYPDRKFYLVKGNNDRQYDAQDYAYAHIDGVTFEGNTFTALGNAGLHLSRATKEAKIIKNKLTDCAGSGIVLGGFATADHDIVNKDGSNKAANWYMVSENNLIEDNTIRNIGRLARDGMSETDREIIRIMLGE